MPLYLIRLIGCDDTTEFTMELTDQEADLLEKISIKSQEVSTYNCMPKLKIHKED